MFVPKDRALDATWLNNIRFSRKLSRAYGLSRNWSLLSMKGKFKVDIEVISDKGWNFVLLAKEEETGSELIVKAFQRPAQNDLSKKARERRASINAEVTAAFGCVQNEKCVQTYRIFDSNDAVYLFQEALLPLGKVQMNLQQVIGVYADVAAGLAQMQRFGIIHNDIKPENLMLKVKGNEFKGRLIDFDGSESNLMGRFHSSIHSPAYVAPEKAAIIEVDLSGNTPAERDHALRHVANKSGYFVRYTSIFDKKEQLKRSVLTQTPKRNDLIWQVGNPLRYGDSQYREYDSEKSDVYSLGVSLFRSALGWSHEAFVRYIQLNKLNPLDCAQSHLVISSILNQLHWKAWDKQPFGILISEMVDGDPLRRPTMAEVARRLRKMEAPQSIMGYVESFSEQPKAKTLKVSKD